MFVTFQKQPEVSLFDQAVAEHKAGRLPQAEAGYRKILAENPNHSDAIHMLGLLAHQTRNFQAAVQLIEQSLAMNPNNASAFSNLGEVKRNLGLLQDAERLCRRAIELDPNMSAAHVNASMAIHQQGRFADALPFALRAIELAPRDSTGYTAAGLNLTDMGRGPEAIRYFEESVKINPNDPGVLSTLGMLYARVEMPQQAYDSLNRAVTLAPDNPQILLNMGAMLASIERFEQSAEWLEKCLQKSPNFLLALEHLAGVRTGQKKFEEALELGKRILEINPQALDTYATMGEALMNLGRFEETIELMNKALAIRAHPSVMQSLSNAYTRMGNGEEGLKHIEKAIALDPKNAVLHFNRSIILLLLGRLQEAWQEYEWRWQHPRMVGRNRRFNVPEWKGEQLNGKRVLVHAEQGMGDTIFFGRYCMNIAKDHGGQAVVWCQNAMVDLVKTIPGVAQVVGEAGPVPQVDYHIPIMSLPRIYNTSVETVPGEFPYIRTNPEKSAYWKKELAARTSKFKVGLVWEGGAFQPENFLRSASLAEYGPLAAVPGVAFFSLQKGPAEVQSKNPPAEMDFTDLAPHIKDFSDTAAILENLDLLISIDTSVIHVAAALNKPVLMFLAWSPGHMWMYKREDTPWYPTIKIFRQPAFKDWATPVSRVKAELERIVGEWKATRGL